MALLQTRRGSRLGCESTGQKCQVHVRPHPLQLPVQQNPKIGMLAAASQQHG